MGNTETCEIRVPDVKIQGKSEFIIAGEFGEGGKPLTIKSMRVLMGIATHWLNASLFWRVCLQPSDARLVHGDECGLMAKCADPELVNDFWSTMQLSRQVADDKEIRPDWFKGDLRRLVEVCKRFPDPSTCENVVCITGDATLESVGCISWNRKSFANVIAEKILREFNGPWAAPPIIADVEMISSLAGVVIWGALYGNDSTSRQIIVVGADIRNVFSWLRKGKALIGRSRRIVVAYLLRRIGNNIEAIPFYIRTYHNLSADLITRATEGVSLPGLHDMEWRGWVCLGGGSRRPG